MKILMIVLSMMMLPALWMLDRSNDGPRIVEALEEKGFKFLSIKSGAYGNRSLSELEGRSFTVTFENQEGEQFSTLAKINRSGVHFGEGHKIGKEMLAASMENGDIKSTRSIKERLVNLNSG